MNKVTKLSVVVLLLALMMYSSNALQAQEITLPDDGSTEPYHPGLVSFRVGIYFYNTGHYERALQEFTITTDGLPNWGIGFAARGDTYAALGEYELAIADYDRAISIFPDFVSALYTRGRAYHALGETERAAADYANAIGQMPEYALPYWGLGDILLEQSDKVNALASYRQYVALIGEAPDEQVLAQIERLEQIAVPNIL